MAKSFFIVSLVMALVTLAGLAIELTIIFNMQANNYSF